VPLTIGAHRKAALKVVAEYADRWNTFGGFGLTSQQAFAITRERNAQLDHYCTECGREPRELARSFLVGFTQASPWRRWTRSEISWDATARSGLVSSFCAGRRAPSWTPSSALLANSFPRCAVELCGEDRLHVETGGQAGLAYRIRSLTNGLRRILGPARFAGLVRSAFPLVLRLN
jgi:hypothetical protein